MRFLLSSILVILTLALCLGCSGNEKNPIAPSAPLAPPDNPLTQSNSTSGASHSLWGLWRFEADPAQGTLDVIPLRSGEMHANVIPFLQNSPVAKLTISGLTFDGDLCDVDVNLTHPFPGLTYYIGFDVAGIFISSGTVTGFHDTDLVMGGEGDTRLLNADGYSRWWNPFEFPNTGKLFGYVDGKLGVPNSKAHYTDTLNGYRLFGDELGKDDDVLDLLPETRFQFSPGATNSRHYKIDFTGGLIFNYAVDANWEPPTGAPPYTMDNFPPEANRPEAWMISVTETENTLYNDGVGDLGGDLTLLIDVWDHYNAGLNKVWVDSPGNFDVVENSTPIGGTEWYSTYQVDITGATPYEDSIDMLIGVESEVVGYYDVLPDNSLTAYFTHTSEVTSESPGIQVLIPNGGEEWEALTMHDITWTAPPSMQYVDIYYSKDDFGSDVNLIESNVPNTGLYSWEVANDPSDTVKVKVTEAGGGQEDVSDDYFTILEVTCDFGTQGWTLAQDYANVPGVWSHTGILCTYKDPVQKIIGHSWSGEGNGGIIKVFDASNPLAGAVATYDTGDLIYCNNDSAMWIDKYSEPGVDRIAYNNFGSGSPTAGYQLKIIDWNGTSFGTPQTLPKSGSIWNLCFTPDGDIILHNAQSVDPSFYFLDKSNSYNYSFMFKLQPTTCGYGSVGNIREIVYDPEIDAVLMFCNNGGVSAGGQLFALSMTGELLFQDLAVFDIQSPDQLGFRVGIDIDLQNPACRIVLYASEDNSMYQSVSWHFARYSGDLDEKATYKLAAPYYGPCRGDIATDGTLWASPHSGSAHFYKFTQPPDW